MKLPFKIPAKYRTDLNSVKLSAAERRALHKKERMLPSAWNEKYVHMPEDSFLPGPWRKDTVMYASYILDAIAYKSVRKVTIVASPQTGKSTIQNGFYAYTQDQCPGNTLFVYPERDTAQENCQDRLQPLINNTPVLRAMKTSSKDDFSRFRIKLQHTITYFGWSSSATKLANKPLPFGYFDEADKCNELATNKKETSPDRLFEKRMRTFSHMSKVIYTSTPTVESAIIWQQFTKAECRFCYWVKCPFCGEYHVMDLQNLRVFPEKERDPVKIESKKLAKYVAPCCGERWNDDDRNQAVKYGEFREEVTEQEIFSYLEDHNPISIAFQLPTLISPFVTLAEIMGKFFESLKNEAAFKDFKNDYEAVPWVIQQRELPYESIVQLKDDRPAGLVPKNVGMLTCGMDSHGDKKGFYYAVRAWSSGLEKKSWLIRHGIVYTFEELAQIVINDRYTDVDGDEYFIKLACIDSRGHKTSEVYEFCRMHTGIIIPTIGMQTNKGDGYLKWGHKDFYPNSNKKIPGGLKTLQVDTTYYKHSLANKIELGKDDPGAWLLHGETSNHFCRQMISEAVNEKGIWEVRSGFSNHYFDCEVLNMVAYDVGGGRYAKPGAANQTRERIKRDQVRARIKRVADYKPPALPGRNGFEKPDWMSY